MIPLFINLIEKITDEEMGMLAYWRDAYAEHDDQSSCKSELISIPKLLELSWNTSKQNLYRLLGENLIITKQFDYTRSADELVGELDSMLHDRRAYGREERTGYQFVNNFFTWYHNTFPIPSSHYNYDTCRYEYDNEEQHEIANRHSAIQDGCCNLVSLWCLAENKYDGESFTLTLPNGKSYTVTNGCKPMRALAKIAEAFNIEGFEDFRICHSLVHNQKHVSGEVCLSIHPLDYWTMSDNNCGWSSCMSWSEMGGYRQGTVEMMNSPCVVVAYMKAKDDMNIAGCNWNNKKWRQLFIVDPQCILGIKSYPYFNDNLTNTIVKWLRELAKTNMGWEYFGNGDEPIKYEFSPIINPDYPNEKAVKFDFYSNNMYKDVGSLDHHPMFIGKDIHGDGSYHNSYVNKWYDNNKILILEFNYSGASQCMTCGHLNTAFECESYLCCEDCCGSHRCSECGDPISEDYTYWVEGTPLCESCYNDCAAQCIVCEEAHFTSDMQAIYVKIPMPYKEVKKCYKEAFKYSFNPVNKKDNYTVMLQDPLYVCCEEEMADVERHMNADAHIKHFQFADTEWLTDTYALIDIDDINRDLPRNRDFWTYHFPYKMFENYAKAKETGNYDEFIKEYCYRTRINKIKLIDEDDSE